MIGRIATIRLRFDRRRPCACGQSLLEIWASMVMILRMRNGRYASADEVDRPPSRRTG